MAKRNRWLIGAIPLMIFLLGAVVYEYGYLRIQSEVADREESFSAKAKTLAKYRTLLAQKPSLEVRLAEKREARRADNSQLITGETPSIAAATLQSTIKDMILARRGTIASERVEKPEDEGKFKMITVTIDAVLPDTRALGDTLYAIETQTPHLVVRELDVRIRNFKEPRDLTVKLKVAGLAGGV